MRAQCAHRGLLSPFRILEEFTKKPKTTHPIIETVIQEEATQPPIEETNFELSAVSSPDPRTRPLSNSPLDYDYADYERQVSMSVFDTQNQI